MGNVRQILRDKGLESLVEVKNPLDINPGADDEAHVKVVEALTDDTNVDRLVDELRRRRGGL